MSSLPVSQRDPYHVAIALQDYFRHTGGFEYRTDVRGLCGRGSIVDCLLQTKQGYCEHFATAMVMLLRYEQIPARYVLGYLPGKLIAPNTWQVDQGAAHAWVEVYFPTYGWIRFDPTPGNLENGNSETSILPGKPVPTPKPDPSAAPRIPVFRPPDDPGLADGVGAQPLVPPPPADPGPLGALMVTGLLTGAAALAFVARRRRAAGGGEPDLAYRSVARIAGRLGYKPLPSQTAYEYAGVLGDVLPSIRPELQVVAHAKVEATYARRNSPR